MVSTMINITTLEEYSLRAWPALETETYDGWLLRFANGYTRRANTAQPLYGSTLDLDTKIAYCEAFYQQRGLPCGFKLTPAAYPPELDVELARRGYTRQADTRVMTVDLAKASLADMPGVTTEVSNQPDDAWIDTFCRFNSVVAEFRPTMPLLLAKIEPRCYFAAVRARDEVFAVGLGVRDGQYVGLFDIVVREDARRRGFGYALVSDLLRRARSDGATTGYLQVMANNAPAIQLYTGLGFGDVYPYWYRMKIM